MYSKLIIHHRGERKTPQFWHHDITGAIKIPSLKLTCLPLKINRLKFLLRWPIFKRELLVSRVGYPGENLTMGGVGHLKWI